MLPPHLVKCFLIILESFFALKEVPFSHSLWPESEVVSLPILIVFPDGSASAYGDVAYIRWTLLGGFWTMVMAKSKIAPKNMVSMV